MMLQSQLHSNQTTGKSAAYMHSTLVTVVWQLICWYVYNYDTLVQGWKCRLVPIMLLKFPIILWSNAPKFAYYAQIMLHMQSSSYAPQIKHFIYLILLKSLKFISIGSLYLFNSKYCAILSFWLIGFCTVLHTYSNSHAYVHILTLWIPFCCICNFSLTKSLPQIHWNLSILYKPCILYRFFDYAGNLCLLCQHYAQCFCHLLCS